MSKYIVHILVKKDSQRLPKKNLKSFANTTLLEIAIKKALSLFPNEQVYLNTNCTDSIKIAQDMNINIYKRSESLCHNDVTLDSINYDFLNNIKCENLILINTVTPLLDISILEEMIEYYQSQKIDSLISGNKLKLHAFCDGKAVNFENKGSIPQTQNIPSVDICNWGYGIWNSKKFKYNFLEFNERAVFSDGFKIFNSSLEDSIKISTVEDFDNAERLFVK
jgi:CMP-N-acetylneuraminic acid synthetase